MSFDAALSLAENQEISVQELLQVDLSEQRLLVASACETVVPAGHFSGYDVLSESLSLASVAIGAGSAGVIASLWKVDDYATSLLMVRFYEALGECWAEPASALRTAQLWLRDLTPAAEREFLTRHPELKTPTSNSKQGVDGGSRTQLSGAHPATEWAGFALTGA